jgi:FHA domain
MAKPLQKEFDTCPMLSRSDWGVGHIQQRGLTHAISTGQSPTGFHGPKVAGWLVFLNGCHRGEDVRLPVGETKLGSSWDCDAVITGVGIGSHHAVIRMGSGEGSIAPTGGERIVKINNVAISGPHSLEDGCLVTLGEMQCVVRFSEQMTRGYVPSEAPRPLNMPVQAMRSETVCGWLVLTRGSSMGQDYRIVNGIFRVGSEPGLEATIPDAHLSKHALTLSVTTKECKVTWIADGHKLFVNGVAATVDTMLKESDTILIDHVEGYLKWYRS